MNGCTNQRKYVIWDMNISEKILPTPAHRVGYLIKCRLSQSHIWLNYKNPTDTQCRKRSIFFELSYWKDNLIHHNLNLMHIEKNVGEVLLKWLDALKQKVYDNTKEDIKKNKAPSQSTKRINIQRSAISLKCFEIT